MSAKLCVFDAYGTLFDVAGAARLAAAEPGREVLAEVWPKLADHWRRKQLEYNWIRSLAGAHADFWTVTGEALDHAMAAQGLDDPGLHARLMDLYRALPAYPEVMPMLEAVRAAGCGTAILSNGSPAMLASAVAAAGLDTLLDAVLSVEAVGIFKPHRRVYDLVGQHFGEAPTAVLFVSSNGWDAAAAQGYGFTALWVNRDKQPVDRLPWRPRHVARTLDAVPGIAAAL
jgi:2-haloacid dehalogenase